MQDAETRHPSGSGRPNVADPGRVVAHRGASQTAPENTLAAFRQAADQGARWIEFDVSLLGDRTPVIHHDGTLERCTDARGPLSALDKAHLAAIDAGGWKSSIYAGEPLPTLEAALAVIGELDLYANLEMKPHDTDPALNAQVVADALAVCGATAERILVSSFNHAALHALRAILPDQPLAVLWNDPEPDWQYGARAMGAAALHMNYRYLNDRVLRDTRREEMDLRVFTINQPDVVVPFRDLGLTGVITDHPPLYLEDPEWADWIAS